MVSILIPFAMFMYEDDEDKGKANRCMTAICYSVMTFAIIAAILFISFIFLRKADIPLNVYTQSISSDTLELSTKSSVSVSNDINKTVEVSEISVSFPIYCMAIMAFVGWFLFAIFGGVGLSALPIDLIKDFYYRP